MSELDSYTVACPDCRQPANQPCVYLPVRGVDADFAHYRSAKVRARVALTGTATKRPHNGRINAVHQRAARRALRERDRVTEASPTRRAIARAQQEYDRREYEALRAWLARHAGVLTGKA